MPVGRRGFPSWARTGRTVYLIANGDPAVYTLDWAALPPEIPEVANGFFIHSISNGRQGGGAFLNDMQVTVEIGANPAVRWTTNYEGRGVSPLMLIAKRGENLVVTANRFGGSFGAFGLSIKGEWTP